MTKYAIIGGTGALGGALAIRLARAGQEVWIGSRDSAKARAAAEKINDQIPHATAFGAGLAEAAAAGDICFLTIPYTAHAETLAHIQAFVQGKIVVDTTVPLRPPNVGIVQLPASGSAAIDAASLLGPKVRVVSALQNIGAVKLASGEPIDSDVLVTGDDTSAVALVRDALALLGMRSWHAGPLANSAATEAMTSLLIQINRRYKLGQAGIRITGQAGPEMEHSMGLTVWPVTGLPSFCAGDDLGQSIGDALTQAGRPLQNGDVIVIAQKVISKVEARAVPLSSITPGPEAKAIASRTGKDAALVELILSESSEILRAEPTTIIARHRTGHVLANAGIDSSNVPCEQEPTVLLWPSNPDESARALRKKLEAQFGVTLAVVVSDSMGRPWRLGTTGTAIGVSGLNPLRDRRGESDLYGRILQVTVTGVADEIAAAASLVIGEADEGVPVAIVRGATYEACNNARISGLMRPAEQDLFR